MAVYYKFKSARDYDSIPMDGPFISVGVLKERIFESKHLGRGTDFDLVVTNAQSNEEYLDEAMLIPKNTSVLIRRVPGRPRMPIVTEQEPSVQKKVEDTPPEKSGYTGPDSMTTKYTDETEWDEFGNDLYSIPDALPVVSMNPLPEAPPTNNADEDSKIKALIESPALDWQRQGADGFGPGRGFGRGMGGRMGGRGFGLERKTPPQGYVCHRCKVPGHFIQHCPTNGDPNYDVKRVKPPTGIPKSMLMQTTDGSYALPSGAVAVLKPNEAAFEKEMEGLPSNRTVGDLPPELHCPLCKEVMKDAVLTSKCCFKSFCDKCIRDHIISKAQCICGATNVLADDLLPNKTLRDTIDRILESGNSSAENAGSTFQAQDMESARCPQPKMPSPTTSAASRGEHNPPLAKEEAPDTDIIHRNSTKNMAEPVRVPLVQERAKSGRVADVSEATHESMSFKEPAASQGSAPLAEEEVQQKLAPGDAAKKKKKKKVRVPPNDMWKAPHDMAAENFMMPMGQPSFNPYWNGFQPGMEGYMAPFAAPMPMMGYGLGPFDMPFPGAFPPDPFAAQGFMMPGMPPQRDLAELGMGMNAGPPAMSREEFEARKADVRRRREMERRADREFPRDREFGREVNSGGDISSMKSRPGPQSSSATHRPHRPERPSPDRPPRDIDLPPPPPPRPSKRKPDHSGDRDREYHDRPRERDRQREHDPRDHDRDRERERDRDRERERERDRDRHRDHHPHHRSESSAPPQPPSSATTTSSAAAAAAAAAEKKHKASVFSRISFISGGGEAASKKRKASDGVGGGSGSHHKGSSSSLVPVGGNGYYHEESKKPSVGSKKARSSSGAAGKEYESSDEEDRHFKRKPSRYEPSPPPTGEEEMWDAAGEGDLKRRRSSSRDRKHR